MHPAALAEKPLEKTMNYFEYQNDSLYCEDISLADVAKKFGTPFYIYSSATLQRHLAVFQSAVKEHGPCLPCFAVKANSNLSYLHIVFRAGFGADVVSEGELRRALLAGCKPERIVFSGVGKTKGELRFAIESKIKSIQVESPFELDHLFEIAKELPKSIVPVAFRVNPNVDAKTHPHISTGMHSSKFGLTESHVLELIKKIKSSGISNIEIKGLSCHIGSQITSLSPLVDARQRLVDMATKLKESGVELSYLNLGGGLGIRYDQETTPQLQEYAKKVCKPVQDLGYEVVLEPGRVIAGNTGVLVTRLLGIKENPKKTFYIVDAAMNDLMRPALYDAHHDISPIKKSSDDQSITVDVVGPVCESTDKFAKDRAIASGETGDLYAIHSAGAYGFSISSNYNTRRRVCELMVDQGQVIVARKREQYEELWAQEIEGLEKTKSTTALNPTSDGV